MHKSIDDIRAERDLALCERAELIRMLKICVSHFDNRERIQPRSYNRNIRRLINGVLEKLEGNTND